MKPSGRWFRRLALLAFLALLPVPASRAPASGKDEAAAKVTLRLVDEKGYAAEIEKQRGKVVLVDFWATWCVPCRKGFPHTVELYRKYGKKGLAVISVSVDDPEDGTHKGALEFLKKHKATFPNLISKYGTSEKSFEAFDLGGGGVPHYKVYDRKGKLVATFSSEDPARKFDHADIEAAVRKALGVK